MVLAAGRSSRMAPQQQAAGAGPRRASRWWRGWWTTCCRARARPVVVVTGHRAEEVAAALAGRPVQFVHAADYADGLSASLRAGIAAVPAEAAAAMVCLGDMPLVTGRMIDRLIAAYDPDEGRPIVVPTSGGKQGNPMLWDRWFFPEMMASPATSARGRCWTPCRLRGRGRDGRRRGAARLRHGRVAGGLPEHMRPAD